MGVAIFVAILLITVGSASLASAPLNEPSYGPIPDDQAPRSIAAQTAAFDCTYSEQVPALANVLVSKWSPQSTLLAVARVITIPSSRTITGYEEDPVMSVIDIRSGEVRELGQGNRPEWSASGTFLSFWRDDGYLHILQGDKRVGHLEVSHPDVRWVGDVLYYWYAEEIRTWDRGVTRTQSRVANEIVPRYPRDNAFFSADGERFTITRYATDGTTERYIGVTATGVVAALDDADITYTEWSPRGQTLLMRSQDRVTLRDGDGTMKSASLAGLPGPVHSWTSDGRLLLGDLTPNAPALTAFDRFTVWDGAAAGATATLPNIIGARAFSPDGRHFTGVSRTDLQGTRLELYRCGNGPEVPVARADTTSRSRTSFPGPEGQRFVRPAAGMVVQFLQGRHTGVDVSAPFGSMLFASDDGIVNAVGWVPVGGRRVCVMHADSVESCGYHTALALVAVGDTVVRGQAIALVGMTGQTTGPHVHWEVRQNGRFVDPLAR